MDTRVIRAIFGGSFVLCFLVSALAAQGKKGTVEHMDYGPVIGASYSFDQIDQKVPRGLAIHLPGEGVAVFDTELLKFVKVTMHGSVDLSDTDYLRTKGGGGLPKVTGTPMIRTGKGPGVSSGANWSDPRPDEAGPMSRARGRFKGYFRHGRRIVLSYSVGAASVLDHLWRVEEEDQPALVRSMRIKNLRETKRFRLHDLGKIKSVNRGSNWCVIQGDDEKLGIAVVGAPNRTSLKLKTNSAASLEVRKGSGPVSFRVITARFSENDRNAEGFLSMVIEASAGAPDLRNLKDGGPGIWTKTLTREGSVSSKESGYVNDEIKAPTENPWNAFIRITGLDFFENGDAAVTTFNGDVWLVSGLDASLDHVQWKRFASGLYNPLGLTIRNGEIFVLEQGQITHLQDLNGDAEADFYRRFNGDDPLIPNAYWTCLEHDSQGRFYFLRSGHRSQDHPLNETYGSLIRVSSDGRESQIYAHGFRQANGLGIGPEGQIQTSDQEGNWVPATRIDRVEQGKFYGYRPFAPKDHSGRSFEQPIAWISKGADNSSGGEVFADSSRWGPLEGHWIHLSWGMARIFAELHETVDGQLQGGVVRFPLDQFKAGVMRGAFGPHDGQLYVAGLGVPGWTSVSRKLNTFNRIRYAGNPVHMPIKLRTSKQGVKLVFSDPLNKKSASNPDNYNVKRWTYKYTSDYGSPEYSVENPEKEGRDEVPVSGVEVGPEGKKVVLDLPNMIPVRQMSVEYELKGAGGRSLSNRVLFTIHELRD